MSIGEIITTPTGLAVIVELQPTSAKIGTGGVVVGETVVPPPDGGVAISGGVPSPDHLGGIRYRSLVAQAATAYLAAVGEALPAATGSVGWTSAAGGEFSWGAAEPSPSSAHFIAAQAYQSTLSRAMQPSPIIVLLA